MRAFHIRSISLLALLLAMLVLSPAVMAINKCTDSTGKVSYSDRPCETGANSQYLETAEEKEKKRQAESAATSARQAVRTQERSPGEIKEKAREIALGGEQRSNENPIETATINKYKSRASFVQALAATGPIKLQSVMYASESGHFPESLSDIGFTRADMRTSSFFADLRIASGGEILVLGNARLGESTVIRLVPRYTLGGTNVEWRCSTNADELDTSLCEYDKSVAF